MCCREMSSMSPMSPGVGGLDSFSSKERECSFPPLGDMRDMRDISSGLSTVSPELSTD